MMGNDHSVLNTVALNDNQQEAVRHFGSPLLILAGAGSGKTRVITHKIACLIDNGIPPSAIVALTFTNKAANEMRERAELLNSSAIGATICTFHSFGARFLRRNSVSFIDLDPTKNIHTTEKPLLSNFTIYDSSDSFLLLKSLFPDDARAHLEQMMHSIENAKHLGLTPTEVRDVYTNGKEIERYYHAYQQRLDAIGNVDFGDLILKPLSMLRNNLHIRTAEQNRIQVLMIDEYQDTNRAQYQLVQHLYHEKMYLCAVGDDDQSIYAFRGSDVSHIVNFQQYFPKTTVMHLLRNYRSTQPILSLASHVISYNQHRHQKQLYTEKTGGLLPRLAHFNDDYQEASFIADEVAARYADGVGEIAIVYRTNAQSRAFESEFNSRNIPYRVIGGVRFYAREEIKDLLAYLKFITNTQDEISFRRIINKPARGIGAVTLQKILKTTMENGGDFLATLTSNMHDICSSNSAAYRGCGHVAHLVQYGQELIAKASSNQQGVATEILSIADLLQYLAEESGLSEYYRTMDQNMSSFKSDNIAEFIASANQYPATTVALSEFLEQAELQSERENEDTLTDKANVKLITMHNTKGLEFDLVYIVGLQDGLFPSAIDLDEEKMEEERRLFYVAITRAKQELTLTTYQVRHQYGRIISSPPSRFLTEIHDDFIEHYLQNEQSSSLKQRFNSDHAKWESISLRGQKSAFPRGLPITARAANKTAVGRQQYQSQYTVGGGRADVHSHELGAGVAARFAVGARVFHNDYGTGEVQNRKQEGDQYIIDVRFESGRLAHFIEKYAALEQIATDW